MSYDISVFLLIQVTFTMLHRKDNQSSYHQIQQKCRPTKKILLEKRVPDMIDGYLFASLIPPRRTHTQPSATSIGTFQSTQPHRILTFSPLLSLFTLHQIMLLTPNPSRSPRTGRAPKCSTQHTTVSFLDFS